MKFRFCGGQDAPDWLLTEIATISEVDEKVVAKLVDIVMKDLVERSFQKQSALKAAGKSISESELKACISSLNFILTNAAKHDVEASVLITEIQQLGLPKNLSEIIQESFAGSKEAAQAAFRESGLRLPRMESLDYRVDMILDSSSAQDVDQPSVELTVGLSDIVDSSMTAVTDSKVFLFVCWLVGWSETKRERECGCG